MKKMIAICGLDCSKCDAFLATKNNTGLKEKVKIAEKWCKLYGSGIKPEDINCESCMSKGNNLFNHCKVCGIRRKCGLEKKVENCAFCGEYPCKKLTEFFKHTPDAKENPYKKQSVVDIKKLEGSFDPILFRLRVGDYRIVYLIEEKEVKITHITHRNKGYKWL